MKHTLRYFPILLLLLACETTVEVDIPRYPAQLTVNSLFYPDSVWRIELTENRYILDTARFAAVPDADVRILQNGQVVAELDYQGDSDFFRNGIYTSTNDRPQVGAAYTLAVSHPALGDLTANSYVPVPQTPILSAVLDTLDVRQGSSSQESDEVSYALTIRLDDPPEENFYSLSVIFYYDVFLGVDADQDGNFLELGIEEEEGRGDIQSDNPVVDNVFDSYRSELLFKDISFNGQEYELKTYLRFRKGSILTSFFNEAFVLEENAYDSQGNLIRRPGDTAGLLTLYAVLRTTTEEYYNYNFTSDLQASVENNPFAQPVQVFDNIENGLGIFAGFSQVEKQVTIR